MVFGVIYEYVERATGVSAYIGKTAGLYGHQKAVRTVHLRHMRGHDPIPFDFVLRDSEMAFVLRAIDMLTSETGCALQEVLKPLEKRRVRERKPKYNRVRFA